MATAETKRKMCVVCSENPVDRQSDTCQHSYCENCLSSPNFACPQCVTAAAGSQKQKVGRVDEEQQGTQKTKKIAQKSPPRVSENCKLCRFKGNKTVKAVNKCNDCSSIPLCVDCSKAHRKSKATEKHVVVSLDSVINYCREHDEFIDLYCKTCFKTLCHICVSLNHSDHAVDQFNNVVAVEVTEIRTALEQQVKRLDMFKSDEKVLRQSKATVKEFEDVHIKEIEDHAEECIQEIHKSQEALKKQVRSYSEVGRVLEQRLEAMAELQATVARANRLLNERAEVHQKYVAKLVGLKEELAKLKECQPAYDEDNAKYQQDLKDLHEKTIAFYPRRPNCKIGGFQNLFARQKCTAGGPCVCETCEKAIKLPDASREGECRESRRCICGTCGCKFNRGKLYGNGQCAAMFKGSRRGTQITSNRSRKSHNWSFP